MLSCYQLHLSNTSATYKQDMQTGYMDRRTLWSWFCRNIALLNKPFQLWTVNSSLQVCEDKSPITLSFLPSTISGSRLFFNLHILVLLSPEEEKDVCNRRQMWSKSACLSGIPGFIAAPDFSQLFADVALCRNMLQPEERARAERFKREKVENQKWWSNRDKSLWDHTEEPKQQRELECKNLQELFIVLL